MIKNIYICFRDNSKAISASSQSAEYNHNPLPIPPLSSHSSIPNPLFLSQANHSSYYSGFCGVIQCLFQASIGAISIKKPALPLAKLAVKAAVIRLFFFLFWPRSAE
ncbi:hypothetical protein STRDD11_01849 [Streptococcus sp. DD11]|nr:hypothetical protein STRDD11_01849 [Streptococcus sp. DD11]